MECRYAELDALRGIAACVVVLRHVVNVIPVSDSPLLKVALLESPLRLLFAAHEAVMLFFLLSGFVLSVRTQPYVPYITRRIFRIYFPYLAALALAVIGAAFLHGPVPALSGWFSITWSRPVTTALVLQHVLFIGKYDAAQYNTAFWSLIYEMRISIFFPLVYMMARRIPLVGLVLIGIAASSVACVAHSSPYSADYLITLHYAAIFSIGSFLAQHRASLQARASALRKSTFVWLLLLSFLLITYGQGLPSLIRRFEPLTDWPVVAGCCGLMLAAISSPKASAVLRTGALQFLGRISYSLYLVHATVLFTLVHLFYGRLPLAVILGMFLLLSFALSWLFHVAVEMPATEAGRRFTARAPVQLPVSR